MTRSVSIFLICASVSGCVPLTQTKIIPYQKQFIRHVERDDSFDASWKYEDTLDESRKPKININASYAVSPKGRRYNLRFIPSDRDIGTSYWRTASIWLVDPSDPKKHVKWRNGLWTIHLEFLPPYRNLIFHNQIKIWTFFYNPIIHGPPN